ncbi:MAG: ABC transporter permease [Saccharofermentanales bacterium]
MKGFIKKNLNIVTPILGLILVVMIFGIATQGKIFVSRNLQTILNQSYSLVLLSVGIIFIFSHGGIDFSCASVMAFAALISGLLMNQGVPIVICAFICILVGTLCSVITGTLTVTFGVPAFISSICMMNICRGIVMAVIATTPVNIEANVETFKAWPAKIVVLIIMFIITAFILSKTLLGKYNKAIGENAIATEQSGISVKKYRLLAYMVSGICVGVAAFFLLCRTGRVSTGFANGLQLEVIVALMLGGLPPQGGYRTNIISAIVGPVIITLIGNGLVILGMDNLMVEGVKGLVFLAVVFVNYRGSSEYFTAFFLKRLGFSSKVGGAV